MKGFYFDEHLDRDVARMLIKQGYEVIMAVDVGMTGKEDEVHLAYASERELVMVTFDHPFAGRTAGRTDFYALICLPHPIQSDIGLIGEILIEFAQLFDPEQDTGQVHWLH
jgi:hypothetical protein